MADRRWTVLLVSHGSDATRTLTVSRAVVRLVAGLGVVAAAAALAASLSVLARSAQLSRYLLARHANRVLAGEVGRLGARADLLSDSVAALAGVDSEARLVTGLDPLSADVLRAGIGGPAGVWPERDLLLAAGATGRDALGVQLRLDALMRRANILATSVREAVDSVTAHYRELAATPSIMPTIGFISSRFAAVRYHPILHENIPHLGIDIAAPFGARILAPAAGRVVKVGWEGGYGLMVVVDHGYGLETRYAHMSRTAAHVGQVVRRGDLLGYVGSSGLSTGPHLHYEVRVDGKPVDPLRYVLPAHYAD